MTVDDGGSEGGRARAHLDVVARVSAEVDALAGRPVGEHVEVYAAAHDQLRGALDLSSAS